MESPTFHNRIHQDHSPLLAKEQKFKQAPDLIWNFAPSMNKNWHTIEFEVRLIKYLKTTNEDNISISSQFREHVGLAKLVFIKSRKIFMFSANFLTAWHTILFALHEKPSVIFSIHCFFAKGKIVKGMVRNNVLGDGVGRFMDFPSVRPWRCALYNSNVTLATLCNYPTQNNSLLTFIFLS